MTTLTRGAASATFSTQRRITSITTSQSPSTFVNMALVSFGSPLSRTMRTASATGPLTESPPPKGVTENAASIALLQGSRGLARCYERHSARLASGMLDADEQRGRYERARHRLSHEGRAPGLATRRLCGSPPRCDPASHGTRQLGRPHRRCVHPRCVRRWAVADDLALPLAAAGHPRPLGPASPSRHRATRGADPLGRNQRLRDRAAPSGTPAETGPVPRGSRLGSDLAPVANTKFANHQRAIPRAIRYP